MTTFLSGVSATLLVGILIWLIFSVIEMLKRVKSLEQENQHQWRDIEERYNSIERKIDQAIEIVNRRIDENYSYTDSRFDKLENKLTNKK
jgi:predicted Holliday junction resolvase-like endonuclease